MNKNKLAELGIFKDRQDGTLKNGHCQELFAKVHH